MRTIIAGSRGLGYIDMLNAIGTCPFTPTTVISGNAVGIDRAGEVWARLHRMPLECYPADWATWGRSAGYKRNELMASKAEALIAVWDGQSKGTKHMIDIASAKGLVVHVHVVSISR
jgi:hypothetical protein